MPAGVPVQAGRPPAECREPEELRAADRADARRAFPRPDAERRVRRAGEPRRQAAWRARPPERAASDGAERREPVAGRLAERARVLQPTGAAVRPVAPGRQAAGLQLAVERQPGAGCGPEPLLAAGGATQVAGSGAAAGPGSRRTAEQGARPEVPARGAGAALRGPRRGLRGERAGLPRNHRGRRRDAGHVPPEPAVRRAPGRPAAGRARAAPDARRDRARRRLRRPGAGHVGGRGAAALQDCRGKPGRRREARTPSPAVWPCPGTQAASTEWRRLKEADWSLSWSRLVPWPT
ncbi:hypothetical protein DES45_103110 [Microvirga subterranea]|uniref:Uncharacterized protein n=1 Tax=Microvirga subterranea TaxID=186651 RepID=A0A370HSE0_9HYPH|nr:hypothetical protein DES45_103110 [Microvirga subterranea]